MTRALVTLAALVALLAASAPRAGAVPAPDSAGRAALQERIGALGQVQILTPEGPVVVRKPTVRDDGIHMREPYRAPRPALVVIGRVPAAPTPPDFVPWSRIDEVQVGGALNPGSMAGGALIGGLVMLAVSLPFAHSLDRAGVPQAFVLTLGAGSGAVVGALFGAGIRHWRTVYPPPASR